MTFLPSLLDDALESICSGECLCILPPAVLWRQARSHCCAVVASLRWALSCCDQRPLECRYQHILTLVKGPDRQQLAAHFLAVVCGLLNGGGFGCLSAGPQACCNLRKSIAHLPVACSPGTLVASGPAPSSTDFQLMNRRIVFRGPFPRAAKPQKAPHPLSPTACALVRPAT